MMQGLSKSLYCVHKIGKMLTGLNEIIGLRLKSNQLNVNIFDLRIKIMKAEIITIGDEILIGQIVNTNSQWIAQQLNLIGVQVCNMCTIADDQSEIKNALDLSIKNHDIVIITGGLGPTKDDLTKQALTDYTNSQLVISEPVKKHLEAWFASRGKTLNEANKTQWMVPESCEPLLNLWGTAPGMLFRMSGKLVYSLPGVPVEMQQLFKTYIVPELKREFNLPPLIHKSFNTEGIPESDLMKTIENWEDNLPDDIKLAYLPSSGMVKLRLSTLNKDGKGLARIEAESVKLKSIIGDEIFGEEDDSLEKVIKELLVSNNITLTTAESCTGGYLSHKLTSVPGISKCFPGGFVTYDYWVKNEVLGIPESLLQKYGAVSREVVEEMAKASKKIMKSDYSIALSGIAGPDGGTEDKPVGTVWIGWATPTDVISKRFQFPGDRAGNIHRSYMKALSVLRKLILGIPVKQGYWEK